MNGGTPPAAGRGFHAGAQGAQRAALAVSFACLCAAYLVWGWCNDITDLGGDSAYYMLAAEHFSPFAPPLPALEQAVRASQYPPLFPLVVGLLGGSFLAGHLVAVGALLAAIACLYAWLCDEGCGTGAAAWACGLFALMPGTYLQALNIWTENPYLLLSLVAIVAANRAAAGGRQAGAAWWLGAAAVAAATLVRAAAVPLLAAFALQLLMLRPRRWPLLLATAAVPFAAWAAWSRLNQAGLSSYAEQWSQSYAADPLGALSRQVGREALVLLGAWTQDWLAQGRALLPAALVLLTGGICLSGCAWRLRRGSLDAVYTALYLALVLVWPFPAEGQRLSYVIVPVLLVQGVLWLRELSARWPQAAVRFACMAVPAALSLVVLPSLVLAAARFTQPLPAEMAAARHFPGWYTDDPRQSRRLAGSLAAILQDLQRVGGEVPPGACITAIKPSLVMLYTGRPSYAPPPESVDDAGFAQGMARCRYAYLMAYVSPGYSKPFYPDTRLNGQARIVSTVRVAVAEGAPPEPFAVLLDLAGAHAGERVAGH